MTIGFSLSPGGLLLPYHMGVLTTLQDKGYLTPETPIAGSSAGAIAVAAHACGIHPHKVLDATIQISDEVEQQGGARGRLLAPLRQQMDKLIDQEAFEQLQERSGITGIAYHQVFPQRKSFLQTSFEDKQDLIQAVCHSSTFPFFTTNLPFAIDTTGDGWLPRLLVDGFFTVPRNRFGCPDFEVLSETHGPQVERTVTVSVFPHETIGLEIPSDEQDMNDEISPCSETNDIATLLQLATQSSSSEDLTKVYESGMEDAEEWCRQEERRQRQEWKELQKAVNDASLLN